jgi:hypothetical protein
MEKGNKNYFVKIPIIIENITNKYTIQPTIPTFPS